MAFRGWPVEAVEFFEGLEADNTKVYWRDHKAVYDRAVRAPMDELLAELAAEFGEGKVFRPYRDVRFSADKTPYKTNLAAMIGESGYVSLSAEGLSAGSGMYMLSGEALVRYRRAVDDDVSGREVAAIVAALTKAGYEATAHDVLKTVPRGYAKDHPRLDLLRHKGLIAWKTWPIGSWLGTRTVKARLVKLLHDASPLRAWLDLYVGPSGGS